jgi:hypothetical protein
MLLMPHGYVDSVTLTEDQITFRVQVTDFGPSGGDVEVSGEASQVGGALAIIFEKVAVPKAPNGDGDETEDYFVEVTAAPVAGSVPFRTDQDVSVFVRVARAWLTVLGNNPAATGQVAGPGTGMTWDVVRTVAQYAGSEQPATAGQS